MNIHIRPVSDDDVEALVQIALLAWPEVFRSFRHILGDAIYTIIWPDWKACQKNGVETVCHESENTAVWVAELNGTVAGFLAYELDHNSRTGEVQLLAVHPDYQNSGIGTALNNFALNKMKEVGMILAKAETGGDPAHAPARKSYEKAGYTGLPLVRYFKAL